MVLFYRALLLLYPAAHRHEFGPEMTAVFVQANDEYRERSLLHRSLFYAR